MLKYIQQFLQRIKPFLKFACKDKPNLLQLSITSNININNKQYTKKKKNNPKNINLQYI